jgi:hypothetical protein
VNVNLTPAEYAMVCRVADYYNSFPAALGHDWIMREAARQYGEIYLKAAGGEGGLGTGVDPAPSQDPPPAPDRDLSDGR